MRLPPLLWFGYTGHTICSNSTDLSQLSRNFWVWSSGSCKFQNFVSGDVEALVSEDFPRIQGFGLMSLRELLHLTPHRAKFTGFAFVLSVLDELAQADESVVPLLRDEGEVAARVFKALVPQLPNALAPMPCATHETRLLHHTQVLGNGLTGDVGADSEPSDGHRSVVTEARDKA